MPANWLSVFEHFVFFERYSTWFNYKDLILNSFKEIKADIKELQDDIKEMKDGFTPVTNQNVSGSEVTVHWNLKKNTMNFSNIREGMMVKY